MAKITINGQNLLQDLNDDWGGENNSGSTQNIHGTPVPNGSEWGMNRGEVERFLKEQLGKIDNRVGHFEVVQNQDLQNVVAGFKDEDAYDEWRALSDEDKWGEEGQAYLITYAVLPSAQGQDAYMVTLSLTERPNPIQATSNVSVHVTGTSKVVHPSGQGTDDVEESLTVQIQTKTSDSPSVPYQTRGQVPLQANDLDGKTIDLKDYLYSGTNYVRLQAIGEYATSVRISFSINVVNLAIRPLMTPQLPITDDTLSLKFIVSGAADKTIEFEFLDSAGVKRYPAANIDYDTECVDETLGTEENTDTGRVWTFSNQNLLFGTNNYNYGVLTEGVHTVRARLLVKNTDIATDWVEYQYMVNRTESTTPMIVVNNVGRDLENWTEVKFFDWSAFTGGDNITLPVHFKLKNSLGTVTYLEWTFNAQNETTNSFTSQLGIEISDTSVTEFYGYMHILDDEDNALASPVFFHFLNKASNQPTSGAEFILNPSSRNNSESEPRRIINSAISNPSASGYIVGSTFDNFNMITDGWMEVNKDINDMSDNAEKVRVLRVLANRKLTIDYNPFKYFTSGNSNGRSMTLEIDFRVINIVDDSQPIFRIGKLLSGEIQGFEMLATEAYVMTDKVRARDDQNVSWAEDRRTRLTVNVWNDILGTGSNLNLVRIFLDGIIEREFFYSAGSNQNDGDKFTAATGVGIEIGGTSADIDIFGIRCYQTALSSTQIMQDYKATLATATEKVTFNDANDILEGGNISWNKCIGKYNVIGHRGELPTYNKEGLNPTKKGVSLEIHIVDDDAHSGTLTNLDCKGQGTTAMTYYNWNQSYSIKSNTVFTPIVGTPTEAGTGYAIADGEPLAKKLVGKINFASSMQTHKLGLTWIFNDLFKRLVEKGQMSKPSQMNDGNFPNCRIAVYEKPFLFFQWDGSNYVFKNLMTFGAGKGDKPTFGFKDSKTGNMLMVEGANNDRPLALFRIPWNEDVYYVTKDQDADNGEAWHYNGKKQVNFGFGQTAEDASGEYPSNTTAINAMKAFFNFVYLHNTRIEPYDNTISHLRANTTEEMKNNMYWVTTGSEKYNLYRFDPLYNGGTGRWVDAGVGKLGDGVYEPLNLLTQYDAFKADLLAAGETVANDVFTDGDWANVNNIFLNMRRAHFKRFADDDEGGVVHIDDALYHLCFVKFYAGTDNRAKNTYYYTDPVTLKIRFEADDLDTMLKTNNVGQNRKPYYVEEHDRNEAGDFYWMGEESGLYNLLEEAFEDEMVTMMYNMFSAMIDLSPDSTITGFHEKYFFSTLNNFPAIAFNKQAQIVYEAAAIAQNAGIYTNTTVAAITQSVGSQRWSEYQWLLDRTMYLSSWCEFGIFAGTSTAAAGSLSWRGRAANQAEGWDGIYRFTLTPAKWLYPRVGFDSGNHPPAAGKKRVRVPAGTPFAYNPSDVFMSDAMVIIRGIDYYFDIGDMNVGLSSGSGAFTFVGKKLQRITINPNNDGVNKFLATSIAISNATNIKEFVVRNVSTLRGAVDLSKCTRLEKIDLRGCANSQGQGVGSLNTSDTSSLTELRLPASLTSLSLVSPSRLGNNWSIDSTSKLTSLSISGESANVGYRILYQKVNDGGLQLTDLSLENEEWTNPDLSVVDYITDIPTKNIKVIIHIRDQFFSFSLKQALMTAFGNIDDPNNYVWVDYTPIRLTSIHLSGVQYMSSTNFPYKLNVTTEPLGGNNFTNVEWTCSNDVNAEIDEHTGVIHVIQEGSISGGESGVITCTVTTVWNGETVILTDSMTVYFYQRTLMLGDYVFSDGSYAPSINEGGGRTAIGRCFYINPDNILDRRMFSLSSLGADSWGLRESVTLGDGTVVGQDISGIGNTNGRDAAIATYPISQMAEGRSLSFSMTRTIVNFRNYILAALATPLPIPEEQVAKNGGNVYQVLEEDMQVASTKSAATKRLYHPAASRCWAFEPIVNVANEETLDNRFKAGNWYLPSVAELKQISDNVVAITTNHWSWCESSYANGAAANCYPNTSAQSMKETSYNILPCCNF